MKNPGITISPNPSIVKESSLARRSLGKTNLIGASNDFATDTITSVPNTQNISQKKRPERIDAAILKFFKDIKEIPWIAKINPIILLDIQCFV